MNSLINSDSRSSRSLHKIARELHTTPAYLEGETEDPGADAVLTVKLSADQRELVERYDRLTPADRRALMQIVRSMEIGGGARTTLQDASIDYRAAESGS